MNIENLAKKLATDNLEQYIIDEFTKGKEQAELSIDDTLLQCNEELNKIDLEEAKIWNIFSLIFTLKKASHNSVNDELYEVKKNAKKYATNKSIDILTEKAELLNFANYYLEFLEFQGTKDWLAFDKLSNLKNSSQTLHLQVGIISKLNYYFEILNTICKIESFTWSWQTFEDGLIKVFQKLSTDKIEYKIDHKAEIEILKHRTNHEIDNLKYEIKKLEREVGSKEVQIENMKNFYDKYYYKTETVINNTFFGDNQPFLLNLYNFLKRNNLCHYSWSYFYSCMIAGNKEIIPLESAKNLKFIGRVFYNLGNFLVSHYKDEPEKFFYSKFYINNEPLSAHFFKNHVYIKIDLQLNPFIEEIDVFFDKQKKIYLKS